MTRRSSRLPVATKSAAAVVRRVASRCSRTACTSRPKTDGHEQAEPDAGHRDLRREARATPPLGHPAGHHALRRGGRTGAYAAADGDRRRAAGLHPRDLGPGQRPGAGAHRRRRRGGGRAPRRGPGRGAARERAGRGPQAVGRAGHLRHARGQRARPRARARRSRPGPAPDAHEELAAHAAALRRIVEAGPAR